jgi:hypothetical protein
MEIKVILINDIGISSILSLKKRLCFKRLNFYFYHYE